ncbi:hypothetical protein HDU88_000101 [Geranomyces variabilis]|nr:hypothetical protein HDU88_000101 [Geranomyces variabilis]
MRFSSFSCPSSLAAFVAAVLLAPSAVVAQSASSAAAPSASAAASSLAVPSAVSSSAAPLATGIAGNGTGVAGNGTVPAGNATSPLATGLCNAAKMAPCVGAATKETLCSDKALQTTVATCLRTAKCDGQAAIVTGFATLPTSFCLPAADKLLHPDTSSTTVALPPSTVAPFVPASSTNTAAAAAAGKSDAVLLSVTSGFVSAISAAALLFAGLIL